MEEKAARTPAQQKMDSQLIYAVKRERNDAVFGKVPRLSVNVNASEDGRVVVDILGNVSDSLLQLIERNGGSILSASKRFHSVRADLPLARLETIAASNDVRFIRRKSVAITSRQSAAIGNGDANTTAAASSRPDRAARVSGQLQEALTSRPASSEAGPGTNVGNSNSEGDVTHRAREARRVFGFDGTGVKIGVLSDGVANLEAAQKSGDLGAVTILPGQRGSGDEGTAMLEIVHDLAPGAELFFATAFSGSFSFAENILALREAGCDIIVDDVFYSNESPFQDGQPRDLPTDAAIITQAVNDVTADGALYFSSAGNSGNKNDNQSGVWEGDFNDGGSNPLFPNGTVNDFDPTAAVANSNGITVASNFQYDLFWSDPLAGSRNDYDLFIVDSSGTAVLASSTTIQNGTQDPWEFIDPVVGPGARMVIFKATGAENRYLHLQTNRGRLQFSTAGTTAGHSAAAQAFSVAAVFAGSAYPGPFDSGDPVETFSSDGPRRLFYDANGQPYTPGNFSSTGGIVRQKPDIAAADGVSVTGVGAFPSPFFGTSAAAPHAAAIAGLLKSANTSYTPAQIRTFLTSTAIDIEAPGVDRDSGVGIVMAYESMQAAVGTGAGASNLELGAVVATESGGNANTFVEPGENGQLSVELKNYGSVAATGITATLSTTTPGVSVTNSSSAYPDIAPAPDPSPNPSPSPVPSATNTTPFTFAVSGTADCATQIDFTLTVTSSGGQSPRVFTFSVNAGQQASISETLDATPPANGTNYAATTGTQTGRLGRTDPPSSCGFLKPNPGALSGNTAARQFDRYSFTNTSTGSICVTVNLAFDAGPFVQRQLQVVAYTPAYNPSSPGQNYIADTGFNAPVQEFSFKALPGMSFDIVVSDPQPTSSSATGFGLRYTLKVSGFECAVAPPNLAPVNTVPGVQSTAENTPLVFSSANGNQLSVSDPDAGNAPLQVTLSANQGASTLSGTTGLTFTTGDGTADATMTFTGTAAAINAALNGMSFTPAPGFSGAASLQITTNDQGNVGSGGALSDSDTVAITVSEGGVLALSAATYTGAENGGTVTITVNRTGGTAGEARVTYTTSNGTATAGSDYTAATNTLIFADGATTQSFAITLTDDNTFEGDETFTVTLSNPSGSGSLGSPASATVTITENDAAPTPTPPAQSLNISTRGDVGTGENVLIAGTIITGSAPKRVIVRAIGPSLAESNVADALQDPVLELRAADGSLVGTNDNWRDDNAAEIQATGFAPSNDAESAIVATLNPGMYSAVVTGKNDTTGVALAEIYDLDEDANSKLANISTRAFVQTGAKVLIGGFVLGNSTVNGDVIVRAIGPSLSQQGVANPLEDPTLELHDSNGVLIRVNDNWQEDSAQQAALSASGLAPTDPNEAAMAASLPPGAYTAIVAGKNDGTGVGLVEVYNRNNP